MPESPGTCGPQVAPQVVQKYGHSEKKCSRKLTNVRSGPTPSAAWPFGWVAFSAASSARRHTLTHSLAQCYPVSLSTHQFVDLYHEPLESHTAGGLCNRVGSLFGSSQAYWPL